MDEERAAGVVPHEGSVWRVPMKMPWMGGRAVSIISCNPSRYDFVDLTKSSRRLHTPPSRLSPWRRHCARLIICGLVPIGSDAVPSCRVHHELRLLGETRGEPEVEDSHPARLVGARSPFTIRSPLFLTVLRRCGINARPPSCVIIIIPSTTDRSAVVRCILRAHADTYGEGRRRERGEGAACSPSLH
jgi:hypothetical protein